MFFPVVLLGFVCPVVLTHLLVTGVYHSLYVHCINAVPMGLEELGIGGIHGPGFDSIVTLTSFLLTDTCRISHMGNTSPAAMARHTHGKTVAKESGHTSSSQLLSPTHSQWLISRRCGTSCPAIGRFCCRRGRGSGFCCAYPAHPQQSPLISLSLS